jgi:MerR family copper efflux transcriptional regulator
MMNIGQLAARSGVSAKMVRYYESINLLPASQRSESGYRVYHENDVHTLRFVRHARKLGFSLEQVKNLLSLWQDQDRASADVKSLALSHVADLNLRISELTAMRDTLMQLAQCCQGNQQADCPILQELAG